MGCCKSLFVFIIGYGNWDSKGAGNVFDHHKSGFAATVKVAHKAKQEGGQQGINGIAFQVLGRSGNCKN